MYMYRISYVDSVVIFVKWLQSQLDKFSKVVLSLSLSYEITMALTFEKSYKTGLFVLYRPWPRHQTSREGNTYMNEYVYMYIYVHGRVINHRERVIHVFVWICVYVHMYLWMYMYCMYACKYMYSWMYIHMYLYTCWHDHVIKHGERVTCICMNMCIYTYVCKHVYIHLYMYVCFYICIYTHVFAYLLSCATMSSNVVRE